MTMKTFGEDYPLVLTLLNSDSSTDILHQTPAYLVGLSQTTWNTMNLTLTRGSRHCRIRLSQAGHQPFPALGSEPWISDLRGSPGSSCTFLLTQTANTILCYSFLPRTEYRILAQGCVLSYANWLNPSFSKLGLVGPQEIHGLFAIFMQWGLSPWSGAIESSIDSSPTAASIIKSKSIHFWCMLFEMN